MSNVSYDLDTSGGLMPLIRALIKPPDEDLNTQKPKKPQHPYYKRPGKGHNHDSCDACGEGGDLICCDRCPASFHLGCYDPPLDENDIPAGQWVCRECRAAEEPASPTDSKSDAEKKSRTLRNNRTNSAKKKIKEEDGDVEADSKDAEKESEKDKEKELSPMEVLVRAARIMNPRQFELPRDMRVPCLFPGTEKEGGKNGSSSLVSVDAWGCVPLPAKLCYVCQQTCKAAPLLQCDYCPLLFHQDCLDPPLTALPTGRWMCPNHVEQYIDWKLVNSISATERVALWDKFSGPVDQHAIKIDFIRRARNAKPAFRVKVPVGVRGRVVVPPMVRYHYKNPPPLLPSRREYVRCARVLKNLGATHEESEDGPKHRICLNAMCPQYEGEGPCPLQRPGLKPASDEDAADDLKAIEESEVKAETASGSSSDLSDSDLDSLTAGVKRRRVCPARPAPRLRLRDDDDVRELLDAVDQQLHQLDERLVRLLAWQRLQQVSFGEQWFGSWARAGVSARVGAAVRRGVAAQRLACRGEALPSALLSAADRRRIAAAVWGAPPPVQATHAPAPQDPRDAAVRATLTATSPTHNGDIVGAPIPMRRASISIGSDSGCDVRLPPACRRASPHHATIFMDEVTRHFELINYSEWGTVVNGVLYACDVGPRDAADADARPQPLRDLLRDSAPAEPRRINGSLTKPLGPEATCLCREPTAAEAAAAAGAWEGSALVPHGALLVFGCQPYVFSITDYLAFPYDDDDPAL